MEKVLVRKNERNLPDLDSIGGSLILNALVKRLGPTKLLSLKILPTKSYKSQLLNQSMQFYVATKTHLFSWIMSGLHVKTGRYGPRARVWPMEIASKLKTCQQPKRPQNCPNFPHPQFQINTVSGKDEWDL